MVLHGHGSPTWFLWSSKICYRYIVFLPLLDRKVHAQKGKTKVKSKDGNYFFYLFFFKATIGRTNRRLTVNLGRRIRAVRLSGG